MRWATHPVIYGTTCEGTAITLFNAAGFTFPLEDSAETLTVEAVASGCHFGKDEFERAWINFDWLDSWLNPDVLEYQIEPKNTSRISGKMTDLAVANLPNSKVILRGGVTGTYSHTTVSINRYSVLVVEATEPDSWREIFEKTIKPFQDFLTVALGRPVMLTRFQVPIDDKFNVGPPDLADVFFQPDRPTGDAPTFQGLIGYTAPTLFRFSDITEQADTILTKWYKLEQDCAIVIQQLMTPYNAPSTSEVHNFLATFQALEAWNGHLFPGGEQDKVSHDQRVSEVVKAVVDAGVEPKVVDWTERILRSRNDKPLTQRVTEVVSSVGPMAELIFSVDQRFAQHVAKLRAKLAHPSIHDSHTIVACEWYGEVIRWILRASLLQSIGLKWLPSKVCERPLFKRAVEHLRELKSDERAP